MNECNFDTNDVLMHLDCSRSNILQIHQNRCSDPELIGGVSPRGRDSLMGRYIMCALCNYELSLACGLIHIE